MAAVARSALALLSLSLPQHAQQHGIVCERLATAVGVASSCSWLRQGLASLSFMTDCHSFACLLIPLAKDMICAGTARAAHRAHSWTISSSTSHRAGVPGISRLSNAPTALPLIPHCAALRAVRCSSLELKRPSITARDPIAAGAAAAAPERGAAQRASSAPCTRSRRASSTPSRSLATSPARSSRARPRELLSLLPPEGFRPCVGSGALTSRCCAAFVHTRLLHGADPRSLEA